MSSHNDDRAGGHLMHLKKTLLAITTAAALIALRRQAAQPSPRSASPRAALAAEASRT